MGQPTQLDLYRAELLRQLDEAYMCLDWQTGDRIAALLGVKSPVEHEREDIERAKGGA